MKILLTGGGTLGSVSPLIAIYEQAQKQEKQWEWFWVGTKNGVERKVVESLKIQYEWVPTAKLRRYFSFKTIFDPFLFIVAFFRSLLIISTVKPDIIIGAGSFVSVPVIWSAWLFRKKIIIHQQDIRPTLSNKLTAWCSNKITVSFSKSLEDYSKEKTEWIGNPVRDALLSGKKELAREKFNLKENLLTILITGGSSGSGALNKWTWQNLDSLCKRANVIHLTGYNKLNPNIKHENYKQIEFLGGYMFHVLHACDIVITRAGISILAELAYLSKVAIVIPMPGTHQEDNAFYVESQKAAIVYRQDKMDDRVMRTVINLINSETERAKLSQAMGDLMKKGARERMIEILESI